MPKDNKKFCQACSINGCKSCPDDVCSQCLDGYTPIYDDLSNIKTCKKN